MSFEVPSFVEPVLKDLSPTGLSLLFDRGSNTDTGTWSTTVWLPSGGGSGISVAMEAPLEEQVRSIADQIQEIVIEELWAARRSASWPECVIHSGHPLTPVVAGTLAVWKCPRDGIILFPIGELSPGTG